jgi:hypothetical protein
MLDGVARGMQQLPSTELDQLPRMADFGKWGSAIELGLGWTEGSFLTAYEQNRAFSNETALEGSPITGPLTALLSPRVAACPTLPRVNSKSTSALSRSPRYLRQATYRSRFLARAADRV